jgi:hypothetical protein
VILEDEYENEYEKYQPGGGTAGNAQSFAEYYPSGKKYGAFHQDPKAPGYLTRESLVKNNALAGCIRLGLRFVGFGLRPFRRCLWFVRHHFDFQRLVGIKMDIMLREGNDDAGLAKFPVDGFVQLMLDGQAVVNVVDK